MSRIGDKVIVIPEGMVVIQDGNNVTARGPKGELTRTFPANTKTNIEGNGITFTRPNGSRGMKTIHGTTRTNFNNVVVDVNEGLQEALGLIRVGYHTQLQGSRLVLDVGYSHPVGITSPAGVTVEVPASTQVVAKGADKEEVSELVASIRGTRPPEPYKGRGIRCVGEYIRRKEGKTGE